MATRDEVIEVRIRIADPAGTIAIEDVATVSALPETPDPQTVYYVTTTGKYMKTDLESGATVSDYYVVKLRVADAYLEQLIDTYGVDLAVCKAYSLILVQLGNELKIVKMTDGAESTEFQDIINMMNFYRQMKQDCQDQYNSDNNNSSGRMFRTRQPRIAGGNL